MLGSDAARLIGDETDPLAGKRGEARRGEHVGAGGDRPAGEARAWLKDGSAMAGMQTVVEKQAQAARLVNIVLVATSPRFPPSS